MKNQCLNILLIFVTFTGFFGLSAQSKAIRIGIADVPPMGGRSVDSGFAHDLFQAVFVPAGYQVVIEVKPWARLIAEGKAGQVDGVWPALYSKEREQWFVFSDPPLVTDYVLIARRDSGIAGAWPAQLRGKSVAVLRSSLTGSWLDKSKDITLVPSANAEESLNKLRAKRVDLMAADMFNARYLLNGLPQGQRGELEILAPALAHAAFHLLLSRENPEHERLLAVFNQRLGAMAADGRLEALKRKYGLAPARPEAAAP